MAFKSRIAVGYDEIDFVTKSLQDLRSNRNLFLEGGILKIGRMELTLSPYNLLRPKRETACRLRAPFPNNT